MCGRENECNEHHVIPRKLHSKKRFKRKFTKEELNETITLCKYDCHRAVHKYIKHKELAFHYRTVEKLLAHPDLKRFIAWIQKQTKKSKF